MTPNLDALEPLIRKVEGFTPLSESDRAALEGISRPVERVSARTDLIREGDKPRGILLVLEGMAYRYKQRRDGTRQIVAYLVPGDMGDLDGGYLDKADHSIGTFSACTVMWIDPDTLERIGQSHPQVARAMRMSTLVDEATLREWLLNVGRRSSIERLAHLFSELLARLQVVGLAIDDSYELPITQSELADTTGITPVHVNRSLQELRRQGLIDLKGGTLRILNVVELKQLAGFTPNYLHLNQPSAA
ncbi:Crp/Fnr family transcriptional regulator [Methylobacterium sp. CM6247]